MIEALARAFAQLGDPRVSRVVWLATGLAVLAFLGLAAAIWAVLFRTELLAWGWADALVDVLGGLAVFGLAYLLFPATSGAIASLFLDRVADAVERRHYPALPPARDVPLAQELATAVRFFGVLVLTNLLALPLYLVPGVNLAVYYGLNGYLLSREYFELVAHRRMEPSAARRMRRANGVRLFVAGVIIAFLFTIPVLNLLMPVIATAFMVHVFRGLAADARSPA